MSPPLFQCVAARRNRPFVDSDLLGADSGCAPLRVGGEALQRLDIEIEDWLVRRHGVFHAHDELHIERSLQASVGGHARGLHDMREVESLDLRFDVISAHFRGEPFDEVGRVLIDARREFV